MSCLLAEAVASPLHDATFAASLVPILIAGGVAALIVCLVSMKAPSSSPKKPGRIGSLVYLAFAGSVFLLAATSFGTILRVGHMSGYALAAHTAGAGAFVFLLLPVAWWLLPGAPGAARRDGRRVQSVAAWMVVVSGLAVAGTMFASMLPLLGTNDLLEAVRWHRWAGLFAVVAVVIHAATFVGERLSRRETQAGDTA